MWKNPFKRVETRASLHRFPRQSAGSPSDPGALWGKLPRRPRSRLARRFGATRSQRRRLEPEVPALSPDVLADIA